ncbi:hypothetical protein L1987_43152 [Smallanthus sonchifolius]|uniref:Uncharacterized protein n=1 Tax=Smallanthus sonchifolius TaxID=185202 RepID=A0ACB9GLU5_9ASTR|nr:hypothetical protein L1987_43152 [Smallanthus sonchifolius]
MDSHFHSAIALNSSPIVPPVVRGRAFEVRPQYLGFLPHFFGKATGEPYIHLSEFEAICGTIDEYYTMNRTTYARNAIRTFQQKYGEPFHETFTRFKEMLRICPYHGIPTWELIKAFCDGLSSEDSRDLYSTSAGTILSNEEKVDWEYLERAVRNSKKLEVVEKQLTMLGKPVGKEVSNVSQVYLGASQGSNQGGQQYQNRQHGYKQGGYQRGQNNQGGYQQQGPKKENEDAFKEMKNDNEVWDKIVNALSKKVGQLAEEMSRRNWGKLPSDTVINPQHQYPGSKNNNNSQVSQLSIVRNGKEKGVENNTIHFPKALVEPFKSSKNTKRGPQQEKMWEAFKQVKINLLLIDAIKQVRDFKIDKSLLDLRASVSILPGSLYDQYEFGPLQKADTTVVLADLTLKLPRGILTNVIVKVEDFYYPTHLDTPSGKFVWSHRHSVKAIFRITSPGKSTTGSTDCSQSNHWMDHCRFKGISSSIVMHKMITEDGVKLARDAQRRLNPNMREVVKKEVLKWLHAGILYPISDSTWVSPTQTVPKKVGIQVVKGDNGEEVATRPVTGWRICIDYRKLNAATSKDHFHLSFIDQIVEKLASQMFY